MKEKISIWCKTYKIVWNCKPWHLIFLSALGLVQALSVIIQMLVIQNFINFMEKDTRNIEVLSWNILLIGAILLIRRLYNAYFNYNINKHIYFAQDIINLDFIKKTAKIPLSEFYNPEFETSKNKAKQGSKSASFFLVIGLILLSFNIPYFIFIGAYYSIFSPAMVLILLFIILPSFYAISKNLIEYKDLEDSISVNRKKVDYFCRCVGDIRYIKETKTLHAKNYFFNKITTETNEYVAAISKQSKFILKNSLTGESVKFVGYICIIIVLIYLTNINVITIGLLAATITSLNDMYSVFNDMVDRDFKSLSSFYTEVVNYLDFSEQKYLFPIFKSTVTEGIEFKNVSYHYPNSDEYIIKNLNFTFPPNQTIAIVGENGAGKTTLSRLLLGLVNPTSGEIKMSSSLSAHKNKHLFSALFQKHTKYPFSLRENVILSDVESPMSDCQIIAVLNKCGVDATDKKIFPNGLDTILSHEFDGVDISGGQWQRIALARCIYRTHNIVLMDEPTSAIDPINESSLLSIFKEVAKETTSIIITHRLGVIAIADYILVMDHGEIIEFGSHDELIQLNGKYKKMYIAQSGRYFD